MSHCLRPSWPFKSREPNAKGRYEPIWSSKDPRASRERMEFPCGRCVCCLEVRGKALSVRITHDFESAGGVGSFLTLTYAPEHLPPGGRLRRRDAELFIKRTDKFLRGRGSRWRGVLVGEYGSHTRRPHYHAILIGHDFREGAEDMGGWHFSERLERLWGLGHTRAQQVEYGSCAYVGQHFTKSMHEPDAFRIMSRRPGIGYGWLERYKADLLKGFITLGGQEVAIPREYLTRVADDPAFDGMRAERARIGAERCAAKDWSESWPERASKAANIRARRGLSGSL